MAHDMTALNTIAARFTGAAQALNAAFTAPPPSSLAKYQQDTAALVGEVLDAAIDLVAEVREAFAAIDSHTHEVT